MWSACDEACVKSTLLEMASADLVWGGLILLAGMLALAFLVGAAGEEKQRRRNWILAAFGAFGVFAALALWHALPNAAPQPLWADATAG